MLRRVSLAMTAMALLAAVIVATGGAQVYPSASEYNHVWVVGMDDGGLDLVSATN